MRFEHQDTVAADLPRIVEIYNFAAATRQSSCDLEPAAVATRRDSFLRTAAGFKVLPSANITDHKPNSDRTAKRKVN